MLKIIHVPNPILENKTKPVEKINEEIKKIIEEMKKTLIAQKDPPGVGLSANQVGIPLAIFLIRPNIKNEKIEIFINPKILKMVEDKKKTSQTNKKQPVKLEGCLSIPKIWGPVKRADEVYLEYQDENGDLKRKWFRGFKAVIIQHEIDHLDGVVFTQKSLEQNQKLYQEKNNKLIPLKI